MMLGNNQPNANYQNLFSDHSKSDSKDKATLRNLEIRANKLEIISEALWRLLKQKTDLTDEELLEEVCAVDLEDGRFDGKKTKVSYTECSKCGRKNSKNHTKCLYCGDVLLVDPFK